MKAAPAKADAKSATTPKFKVGDKIVWKKETALWIDTEKQWATITDIDGDIYRYIIYGRTDHYELEWQCKFDSVDEDCELMTKLQAALV